MDTIWRCYKAEFYKVKNTVFMWIHIGVPLLFILALWGGSYRYQWGDNFHQMSSAFFQLVGFGLPLLVAILCGFLTGIEGNAGGFQMVQGKIKRRSIFFLSKWAMAVTFAFFSLLVATGGFLGLMGFVLRISGVNYQFFLQGSLLLFVGILLVYTIQLVVGYLYGMEGSSILGVFGSIAAALAITAQGDQIWVFIPWAWPIRLSIEAHTISGFQEKQGLILWMLLFTVFCLLLSCLWYNGWENKRRED